jgi:hypothetical protein
VRDLTWSRHQLEELAERRFAAAQRAAREREGLPIDATDGDASGTSFADLFNKVPPPPGQAPTAWLCRWAQGGGS